MSSDSGLSLPTNFSTDSLARMPGERTRPADRDVAAFERAMHGEPRRVHERQDQDSQDAEQDLTRKRLQAQTETAAPALSPSSNASTLAAGIAAPAPAQGPLPIDDLIAQYVQMIAVSDPGKLGDPRMLLQLDASVLPQTDLYLSKAPEGWVLQANTRSPEAYRMLNEFGPALERRFAMRGLGSLSIQTTMHPTALQGITP